jgi:hypothetical protein
MYTTTNIRWDWTGSRRCLIDHRATEKILFYALGAPTSTASFTPSDWLQQAPLNYESKKNIRKHFSMTLCLCGERFVRSFWDQHACKFDAEP